MNPPPLTAPHHDYIFETVVATVSAHGEPHIAPMGVRYVNEGEQRYVVLMPFKPSTTLNNILATRSAVLNLTTDVRVFAGSVTGRKHWPLLPAEHVPGMRLADTLAHVELQLASGGDEAASADVQRPVLHMAYVLERTHAPFIGYNRAQAAVIEGAVLVSRLRMLPREKIESEMAYLQIAIDKTAGSAEREAWTWLREAVAVHFAMQSTEPAR